ncbi:rod shape-determining protein RodA [candidate division WWE3 bacterium]|uniref:Rod shape-determining protein RodA n=1 Tax=candidate division WWE3 bacterium TaxID=2053526 RepID=A0A955LKT7_UNCKA|nr:rod shape-determining protein RodA [candidate division WWE3 bacterium]
MDFLPKFRFPKFDLVIPVAALFLIIIGLSTIQSTILAGGESNPVLQANLINVQILSVVIGFAVLAIISKLNYHYLEHFSVLLYIVAIILLVVVLFLADPTRGSVRWLTIGPVNLQPSTYSTLMLILFFAYYFTKVGDKINKIKYLILSVVLVMIPAFLLLLEPDLGSALLLLIVYVVLLHMTSLSWKKLLTLYIMAILAVPLLWFNLESYQKDRIFSFVNPAADPSATGYNVIQSMIAVGSGQLLGRGWGRGTQSHLQYLPEQHTDFIFATFAEEQGFVGALVLLTIILLIIIRLVLICTRTTDNFGKLIVVGVLTWYCIHIFINIGMNIGIAPITGIPLLFVSYGGSAMVAALTAMGIVESVYRFGVEDASVS